MEKLLDLTINQNGTYFMSVKAGFCWVLLPVQWGWQVILGWLVHFISYIFWVSYIFWEMKFIDCSLDQPSIKFLVLTVHYIYTASNTTLPAASPTPFGFCTCQLSYTSMAGIIEWIVGGWWVEKPLADLCIQGADFILLSHEICHLMVAGMLKVGCPVWL